MRGRSVLLALLVAACGPKAPPPPPAEPIAPPPAPKPKPKHTVRHTPTPAPAPKPEPAPPAQWCWIGYPRMSGCYAEEAQCQKYANEMRTNTKITSECKQQSPVLCYTVSDEDKPLCYASLGDCNDGRTRMSKFGTTSECKSTP